MISDILALYGFLDNELHGSSILNALFSWDGVKKYGSKEISLRIHGDPAIDKHWFYEIIPVEKFTFVPMPTNPAVYFDFGIAHNDRNPNANYFRFVSSPMSKFASGGEENVKVDFMVVGYYPRDLLDKFK